MAYFSIYGKKLVIQSLTRKKACTNLYEPKAALFYPNTQTHLRTTKTKILRQGRKMEALYWLKYDSARYSNLLNCVRFIKNLLKTNLVGGC